MDKNINRYIHTQLHINIPDINYTSRQTRQITTVLFHKKTSNQQGGPEQEPHCPLQNEAELMIHC